MPAGKSRQELCPCGHIGVPERLDGVMGNDIQTTSHTPYRYIRLEVPKDSLNLCEISFFEHDGEEPIHPLKYSTNLRPLTSEDNPDRMTDGLSATDGAGKPTRTKDSYVGNCPIPP